MEPSSQLILRNQDSLVSGGVLLFNPPPDHLFQVLAAKHAPLTVWCQDFGDYRWFGEQGMEARFGIVPAARCLPAQVILFLPREKALLGLLLHFLAAAMPSPGTLWLVGENQSGIRSGAKQLHRFFGVVDKADTARHCALFRASQALPAETFLLDNYQQKWLLGSPPAELRLVSLPGVFAHGRLDRGTALLLEVLKQLKGSEQPRGTVLDFACGTGIIGLSMLRRDLELKLTMLDSSALALECVRLSLQANGLQASVLAADGLAQVNTHYDWIISNPPFHHGVATNFGVSRRFFAQAEAVLGKQGKILLVCNRHLPYQAWLEDHFASVESLASQNGFKVLRAARPKT